MPLVLSVDEPARQLTEQVVRPADVDAEHYDGEDHDDRVAVQLTPGGPDDLAQLVENLAQEPADAAFGGRFGALPSGYCHLSPTWSPFGGGAYHPTCSTWGAPSGPDPSSSSSLWWSSA